MVSVILSALAYKKKSSVQSLKNLFSSKWHDKFQTFAIIKRFYVCIMAVAVHMDFFLHIKLYHKRLLMSVRLQIRDNHNHYHGHMSCLILGSSLSHCVVFLGKA